MSIQVDTLTGTVLGSRTKAQHAHKCDLIRGKDGKKLGFVAHYEGAVIRLIRCMSPEEILYVQGEVQKIRRRQHKAPIADVVARMIEPDKIRRLLQHERNKRKA
jgi:hypothetical protein